MKKNIKVIALVCLLLSFNTLVWGQNMEYGEYQLKISFSSMHNYKNSLCKTNFQVYSIKNGTETILRDWSPGGVDEGGYLPAPTSITKTFTTQPDTKPDAIRFWIDRGYKKFIGGCKYRGNNGGDTYRLDNTKPYIATSITNGDGGNDLFLMFNTTAKIQLHPYEIKIKYFNDKGLSRGQLLPMSDKITLKATKGFTAEVYKWQYSTNGSYWKDFPSSMQNRDEITFSGTDLFTKEEYLSLIKKNGNNVQVRINAVTEKAVQAITLIPNIESPHFVSHSYELETCNGSGDATLYLTMDRALYTGEIIYIAFDNQVSQSNPPLKLDATNTGQLIGLPAKTHNLRVWGAVNGYESYGDASNHYRQVVIDPRAPITHSVTGTKNISCIHGTDGSISISASGGTSQFLGNLTREGSTDIIQQARFATGETGTFSRLKAGTYKISVYDDNNCSNNQIQTVTLSEPAKAIEPTLEQSKQPLAYNSSDGEATIRIKGGTQSPSGYTVRMQLEGGQSYSPQTSSRDGESYLYTFKGLRKGKYHVSIEDNNYSSLTSQDQQPPCECTATMSFYLDAPLPLGVTIENTHSVYCYGGSDGQITAHAQGGVRISGGMPYNYKWYRLSNSGPQEIGLPNDSIANNLTIGTYQVKITDANHISVLSSTITLTQPDSLSLRFETDRIGCAAHANGRVKAFVSGGTPPYKYQWSRAGETKDEMLVSDAGTYLLRVTDQHNCQLLASQKVIASVDATLENTILPLAFDSSDGEATIRIKGGIPAENGYTVQFRSEAGQSYTPQASTQDGDGFLYTFKNLHKGKYYIQTKDNTSTAPAQETLCGSTDTLSFYLSAPEPLDIKIEETHFVNCYGSNEGEITAHAKGGVRLPGKLPYLYTWYQLSGTESQELTQPNDSTARGLKAGTYQVKITDGNHITLLSSPLTIAQPDSLSIRFETERIGCCSNGTGRVEAFVTGGTAPYKYEWNKAGETGKEMYVPQAGMYTVRVTDQRNCQLVATTEIIAPVDATLESTLQPLAYDSSDGEATIRIKGGVQIPGGYTLLFRSESGQSYTPQSSSKEGDSYLYTFKGLHRGKHYLTTGDKTYASPELKQKVLCGSSDTLSFYLPAPPPLEVKIDETHFVNCYGSNEGELTAHAKGGIQQSGIMPYTYSWTRLADVGAEDLKLPNDSIARGMIAGTYQVKITDTNNISLTSAPFLLVQPDSLSISFKTVDVDCSGKMTGKVTAIVKGGTPPYKYQWNREEETDSEVSALEAGMYMLRVTDQRNCQLVATTEIKAPGDLKVDTIIAHPSCVAPEGGSIELKLSGATAPYQVLWLDNQSTELIRKGLKPDTYYVTVTDVNGCKSSYSFKLRKPKEISVKLGEGFTMCHGQSRPIAAHCEEPDVKYEWYRNDTKLTGSDSTLVADKAGVYRVVVTNPQGCTAEDEVTIQMSQEVLDLELAIPTSIAIGSEIHGVNLSTVSADKIKWNLPEEAQIIKQSDTEIVFSIRKKGAYIMSLEGFKGDCSTIVTRTIHVMDEGDVNLPDGQQPLIRQFLVTPNPTTGYFKVMIELNKEEDFTMMLYSPAGVLMDKKEAVNVQSTTFEYEVKGTLQGTYLLHLQTKADKAVQQIVIKRD